MQLFHKLRYFCSDAWDAWRHSKAINLMALSTLAAALFVAALVMLVLSNLDRRVRALGEDLRVDVYLTDALEAPERQALMGELQQLGGVRSVDYVSKEEALARYRAWAADMASLASEFSINPLPASLEVFLEAENGASDVADRIATQLQGRPGVEEVRFNAQWLQRLEGMVELARVGGGAMAGVILIAVVFVMSSVLRLAVHSRKDEIAIMQLVGATTSFIRGPFLVAGLAQGVLASLLALGIVEGLRQLSLRAPDAPGTALVMDLIAAQPLTVPLSALLLVVGMLVSLTGAWFAVRTPKLG